MKFILPLLTIFFCNSAFAASEIKLTDRLEILEALSKQNKMGISCSQYISITDHSRVNVINL